jgi:hypothetical protein
MEARHQCPFVNRPDSRCGQRLNIDRLDHAFKFCFDGYSACPVYLERLLERRVRLTRESVVKPGLVDAYGSSYVQLRTPAAARPATAA